MLHKIKSSYQEIAKYFPELSERISSSDKNKKILLEMAARGDSRPSQKTKIGRALSEYTKKSSKGCHDPAFNKAIRGCRPDWFLTQTQIATQKKDKLIKMAKNVEARPSHDKTRLGQALSNYTRKSSAVHDLVFSKAIRKLRPDWFVQTKSV